MNVRAKFTVVTKAPMPWGGTHVRMAAVYSADPTSENKAFTDATPNGEFFMTIADGKPAADAFEVGKSYYLDISPAD